MRRHAGYRISQIKRQRIEECFRLAKRQTAESASHRSISLPPRNVERPATAGGVRST